MNKTLPALNMHVLRTSKALPTHTILWVRQRIQPKRQFWPSHETEFGRGPWTVDYLRRPGKDKKGQPYYVETAAEGTGECTCWTVSPTRHRCINTSASWYCPVSQQYLFQQLHIWHSYMFRPKHMLTIQEIFPFSSTKHNHIFIMYIITATCFGLSIGYI